MNILLSRLGKAIQADYSATSTGAGETSRRDSAFTIMLALAIFAASSVSLSAAQKDDLQIELKSHRIGINGAKETLTDDPVAPGDVIQYQAIYRNQAGQPLRDLAPTLPIPAGTEYIEGSAKPAPAEASLDGRTFERLPIQRMQKLPDGRQVFVTVPVGEYRALRWSARELPATATFTTTARVLVVSK